jgi:hypothetical protein
MHGSFAALTNVTGLSETEDISSFCCAILILKLGHNNTELCNTACSSEYCLGFEMCIGNADVLLCCSCVQK